MYILTVLFLVFAAANGTASEDDYVRIPATAFKVIDEPTGVPVSLRIDAFLMTRSETTQRDYLRIMKTNPSELKGDELPVTNVSWKDAVIYCNRLSAEEGLDPCYDPVTFICDAEKNGYRLPSSVEWDYADSLVAGDDSGDIRLFARFGMSSTKSVAAMKNHINSAGPSPAGTLKPNAFGLYNMRGNVWEWCGDNADPSHMAPYPANNPSGPSIAVERQIRGGSYASLVNSWSRGYRSSMDPDHKSRFTGFRVVRNLPPEDKPPLHFNTIWNELYGDIPDSVKTTALGLDSLFKTTDGGSFSTVEQWEQHRKTIEAKWLKLLGPMPSFNKSPEARVIATFEGAGYTGQLMYLDVEDDVAEKISVLIPEHPVRMPCPVVIVPYYDVDTTLGTNLSGRNYRAPSVRSFADILARQGFITVSVRWFGESYGEQYGEAVAELAIRHPGLTGLGKWVSDARRLVDYIETIPGADPERIGIIGHSLGGKMAFYAGAFDVRIKVIVASELGIGLAFSNYDDFWYYGEALKTLSPGGDHHELLSLIAPRAFLLIGGDAYDSDASWPYILRAREVYGLYGHECNVGFYNHRSGHSPSPEAVFRANEWIKYFLIDNVGEIISERRSK